MKRRVTVHFGDVRVVVPCQDENTTVADLAEAAIISLLSVYLRTLSELCWKCWFGCCVGVLGFLSSRRNTLSAASRPAFMRSYVMYVWIDER
ncbi:hypothetical protein ANCCAN_29706 [Ancylostoma caninum]|uniref:Par3/HAL N-terminal domain-containing protein n=1 Tax=Ancylostoma caninum TaxID=29170 RepID=A0A368EXW8_ANCCA|nr:hypothetical protein ANCCAN_29706 [Ancylostoma caninum]